MAASGSEISRLASKIQSLYEKTPANDRILIAISGIPGSGKSTLAREVVAAVNALHGDLAVDLPMDGFHLSRAQLAAMPNPAEAFHRRGAAFTFDGEGFLRLVRRLREPVPPHAPATATIFAPSFDHARKDPIADDIPIRPSARVLVLEGNYLSLDREPWRSAAALMDELWFIHVDRELARDRLVQRHVLSGVTPDAPSARHRVDSTDFLNADDILDHRLPVQEDLVSN
ncbi:hypothetical protein ASPZODRAFT_147740 [Penicilliopsis zonata CBS 506.65]|uniref:Phosphoribulokinase/uridine kinase domain-containing protein n=1 Tax=Penicilliopsis zonata CBS 506.65 TaxID=1073090 RepID=A0A1L9S4N3_9EURO|nr:hypothetical protein ASPZODRAFT_147740 [Penicilliopsis zonata CBS 506.65]OJJ42114.1 hypothetical protein ASPZODRAFT_147740 [Penicilliopsis zonata CBS 506.65]